MRIETISKRGNKIRNCFLISHNTQYHNAKTNINKDLYAFQIPLLKETILD